MAHCLRARLNCNKEQRTNVSSFCFARRFVTLKFTLFHFGSFFFLGQGVSSNSSWEQAMKMIINDPRYR